MSEAPSPPGLLTSENDSAAEPGRRTERRWLLGISLTAVLNLALTATAFGGLWLQGSSVELERDRAVTDQLTSAAELIEKESSAAQAAGFRTLERVAHVSPADQGYIVDLAESYLTAEAYKSDEERSVAKSIDGYDGFSVARVPNPAIQAAVTVIQKRDPELDPAGRGQRAFRIPGMVVEAVRSRGIIMRETQAKGCYGAYSVWHRATLDRSDFSQCGFREAEFTGASVRGVNFESAKLWAVNFTNADLAGARFDGASFQYGATFRGADLTDATFAGTDLSEVDFSGVKSIAGADFSQATGIERGLLDANGAGEADW